MVTKMNTAYQGLMPTRQGGPCVSVIYQSLTSSSDIPNCISEIIGFYVTCDGWVTVTMPWGTTSHKLMSS